MKNNLLTMDVILSKEIKCRLVDHHYQPGDKLPSERELSEIFGVQRLTIRSALKLLLQEKSILARPKSGYYMAPERIVIHASDLSVQPVSSSGVPLTSSLHSFKRIHADMHLSSKMLVPEDSEIFRITKIYIDNEMPVMLEHTYLPCHLYPELLKSVAACAPILSLLEKNKQLVVEKSNQRVTLIYANEVESQLLNVASGTPLTKYKGLLYDQNGQMVLYFENIMLVDRFTFIREPDTRKDQSYGTF